MNMPDMDWSVGWAEQVRKDRESDWASEWERGYEDGMYAVLEAFEKELYIATKEDPQYAAYIEDAIKLIKKTINPLIKE
jgi:hypothetical protein